MKTYDDQILGLTSHHPGFEAAKVLRDLVVVGLDALFGGRDLAKSRLLPRQLGPNFGPGIGRFFFSAQQGVTSKI